MYHAVVCLLHVRQFSPWIDCTRDLSVEHIERTLYAEHLRRGSSPYPSTLTSIPTISMLSIANKLIPFLALLCLVLSVAANPVIRAQPQPTEKPVVPLEERLSNAQRLARGLPLNRPRRYHDSEYLFFQQRPLPEIPMQVDRSL